MLRLVGPLDGHQKPGDLISSDDWIVVDHLLRRARRTGHASEQTQLESGAPNGNGPLPVAMTATALRGSSGGGRGVVLVIEDLSELLSAQRAAAWSEVARRMAHEIKNPLTPIQLSAERIAKSYRRARGNGDGQGERNAPNGNGPLPVAMTATALRGSSDGGRGVVLVIEDLSELLSAQRAAAWSEVARRMAHEIKNPLTPIQLSAERIAKSYRRAKGNGDIHGDRNAPNGKPAERDDDRHVAAVIDECTETISREVAGLKAMVDEFSRFARLPAARPGIADLNEVVGQAVGLYEERLDGVSIKLDLDPELPPALLDTEQMRRVFVNLIDNALDALVRCEGEKRIAIKTSRDAERSLLLAEISDTGQGIEPGDFKRLFQPYFSRRDSGTGLGLAIVQRIILEHRGKIRAETNYPRGARFVIELPAAG